MNLQSSQTVESGQLCQACSLRRRGGHTRGVHARLHNTAIIRGAALVDVPDLPVTGVFLCLIAHSAVRRNLKSPAQARIAQAGYTFINELERDVDHCKGTHSTQ